MAMNIYANVQLNGTAITGDVSVPTVGGLDISQHYIEIHGFHYDIGFNLATQNHRSPGIRVYGPIVFTKRIDRSSPLLLQAHMTNASVTAAFRFFRVNPQSRQPVAYHVVEVQSGRIAGVRTEALNNLTADGRSMPELERITVVYRDLIVRDLPSGAEAAVSWVDQ
jgi:type VI secretion system Hcp family effector